MEGNNYNNQMQPNMMPNYPNQYNNMQPMMDNSMMQNGMQMNQQVVQNGMMQGQMGYSQPQMMNQGMGYTDSQMMQNQMGYTGQQMMQNQMGYTGQPMMNQNMYADQSQMMNNQPQMANNTVENPVEEYPVEEVDPNSKDIPKKPLNPNDLLTGNDKPEEDYIREFIGNNANKIMRRKFNFCAFFFGYAYFFYRKQYILGAINIALYYIIPIVLEKMGFAVMWAGIFAMSLVFGFLFNSYYVSLAKRTVAKVRNANPGADFYSVCTTIAQKGGTKFLLFFLGLILFAAPQLVGIKNPIVSVQVGGLGGSSGFGGLGGSGSSGFSGSGGGGTVSYSPEEGVMFYDTADLSGVVEVTVPTKYVRKNNAMVYLYSYDENGNSCDSYGCNECTIEVKGVKWDNGAKDFVTRRSKAFEATPKTKKINNNEWQYIEYEFMGNNYEYYIDHNNKLYLVSLEEDEEGSCVSDFESVLNSFSFK